MLKFEDERVERFNFNSSYFSCPIPIVTVKPKNADEKSVVFIFNGGIGSNIPSCLYMNHPFYDNHYFVTYEKMFHNDNKNKPSQFKKKYILELDEVINCIRDKFPGKRIFLLGESWGTTVNFVYYKKHREKVDGVVSWNAPFKIVNGERKPLKEIWKITWREIITVLFNIECVLPPPTQDQLNFSQDKLYSRLLNMVPPVKLSTKTSLSVWRFMRPGYRFLKKYCRNPNYNFLYVQSSQDILEAKRKIKKVEKKADNKHFLRLPTGYHVLSMEPKESFDLYKAVAEFIK